MTVDGGSGRLDDEPTPEASPGDDGSTPNGQPEGDDESTRKPAPRSGGCTLSGGVPETQGLLLVLFAVTALLQRRTQQRR